MPLFPRGHEFSSGGKKVIAGDRQSCKMVIHRSLFETRFVSGGLLSVISI